MRRGLLLGSEVKKMCEGGNKGATLHLAPGKDVFSWIRTAIQDGRGLLASI